MGGGDGGWGAVWGRGNPYRHFVFEVAIRVAEGELRIGPGVVNFDDLARVPLRPLLPPTVDRGTHDRPLWQGFGSHWPRRADRQPVRVPLRTRHR